MMPRIRGGQRTRDAADRIRPLGPCGRDILSGIVDGYNTADELGLWLGRRVQDVNDCLRRLRYGGLIRDLRRPIGGVGITDAGVVALSDRSR